MNIYRSSYPSTNKLYLSKVLSCLKTGLTTALSTVGIPWIWFVQRSDATISSYHNGRKSNTACIFCLPSQSLLEASIWDCAAQAEGRTYLFQLHVFSTWLDQRHKHAVNVTYIPLNTREKCRAHHTTTTTEPFSKKNTQPQSFVHTSDVNFSSRRILRWFNIDRRTESDEIPMYPWASMRSISSLTTKFESVSLKTIFMAAATCSALQGFLSSRVQKIICYASE